MHGWICIGRYIAKNIFLDCGKNLESLGLKQSIVGSNQRQVEYNRSGCQKSIRWIVMFYVKKTTLKNNFVVEGSFPWL